MGPAAPRSMWVRRRAAAGISSGATGWVNAPVAVVLGLSAAAWATIAIAEVTGAAPRFHHHALLEDGPPIGLATLLFLASWQVMVAAMMLPASLPAIRAAGSAEDARGSTRPGRSTASFLAGFALVWSAFGLLAFAGDGGLHRLVDATPWLAARPWLMEVGVLLLAGAYQFAPRKRRSLDACRRARDAPPAPSSVAAAARSGLGHGIDCLGSSWALMLLMFAEGTAEPVWMVGLTVVMVYESLGRHGERTASIVGVGLLLLGLAAISP